MNKTRTLPILIIFLVWLSLTGFRPLPQAAASPSQNPALPASPSVPAAPEPFAKQLPVNGALDLPSSSVTLQWGASSPGVTYQYCLRTNKAFCPPPKWIRVGANTHVTLQGLTANTRYYWQVRAVDAAGAVTYADGGMWWQFNTIRNDALPGPFNKLSPADAATKQPVTGLGLSWSASSLATSYQYCYDSVNNNTCDTAWTNASGLSANLSGLVYGAIYYWQVRAVNASGSVQADFGTWFSFQTQLAPPGIFGKSSPANNAAEQPLDVTLTWGESAGNGITYEYCIGATACSATSTWLPAGTNLFANPTGLQYETTYYWQVRASNQTDTFYADNGNSWSFSTPIAPPESFGKTSPGNNLIDQPLSLVLAWEASAGNNVHYEYCFGTTGCTPESTWLLAGTNTSASISGLAYATTYYWQVRALNATSMTYADGDTTWQFTTLAAPAQAFSKLSPPAAGLDDAPPNLTLQWSSSTGASRYFYCVDTASHADNDTSCGGTGWVLTTGLESIHLNLDYNQTYYWQVYAENSQGTVQADHGSWWSFTTIPAPPSDFTKISPADGGVDQPLTPWFYWWTPSAPGNKYQACIDTAANCPGGSWTDIPENEPFQITTPLAHNTTYYWQVRADSGGGTTYANNADWTFTTLKAPATSSNQAFSTPENTPITGTLTATSNYGKDFSLIGSPPAGTLDFHRSGAFTYIPTPYFNGVATFQFTVSDGYNPPAGPYTVTITVTAVNDPPTLSVIPDQAVENGERVAFWVQAADPDLPYGEHLTYSIDEALPSGARMDPDTGFFSWPVPANFGNKVYTFTVRVTDSGGLSATQIVKITVSGETRLYMPVLIQ